jgi:ElaB/YqjD/DUF883 family membrane-anchored ribosome-binding protein
MSVATSSDATRSRTDRLAEEAGEAIRQMGNKVEGNLQDAGESLAKAQKLLTKQAQLAADATDEYVHENPWKAVAIAGAAGLLVGLLLNIRR